MKAELSTPLWRLSSRYILPGLEGGGRELVANIKISRLCINIQTSDSHANMANWPTFQHGWSGGKAAPSGQACAAQGPA